MASVGIGERLRNARTARGLTFEDIEAATHIKRHYLDALEREAWDELPGPAYVRGFLASYARQLGISVDEVVGLYAAPAGAVRVASAGGPRAVEVRITPANPQSRLRRIITAIAVVFVTGAVVLAYILVGQLRQFAATRPRPEASAPSAAPAVSPPGAAQPSGVPVVTPTSGQQPAPPGPNAGQVVTTTSAAPGGGTEAVTPIGGQGIMVNALATDRSWVRVVADGAVVFEGFLSAGDHQVWQGRHQVSVRVGNASALDLSVNGRPIGHLGNPGDVAERTFSTGLPAPP
ncbi:MAG TPA: RodZ domain-containing protein, partial [bacterium]|nr:RodZ domain-containing protein [bacterium]